MILSLIFHRLRCIPHDSTSSSSTKTRSYNLTNNIFYLRKSNKLIRKKNYFNVISHTILLTHQSTIYRYWGVHRSVRFDFLFKKSKSIMLAYII